MKKKQIALLLAALMCITPAEESAAASEELSAQAQILKELIGKFKLKK